MINNFGTISVAEVSAPYAAGTNSGNGLFGVGIIPPFDIMEVLTLAPPSPADLA